MSEKTLIVRLYGEPVGRLAQTQTGKMTFSYLEGATRPVSIGMPVRREPYDEIRTEAYFGGLLPEGEGAREAIGKRYRANPHNSFSLLRAIGYDCAGAVSLHPTEIEAGAKDDSEEGTEDEGADPLEQADGFVLAGRTLSEDELYRHIVDLPRKPLFMDAQDLRLSLAGRQDKAAICLLGGEIALPLNGCPTTHILKPPTPEYEGIVQNEAFCLRLAGRLGLSAAPVEIRWAREIPYLLVERYDRKITGDKIRRIHQEDFCQALGVATARKYQNDGGPDFKASFDLLRKTTQPVRERNALAALMILNYLIGNMDAHSKNFSLLHRPVWAQSERVSGAGELRSAPDWIELAPAYDLTCTRVYDDLTPKMAMKIGEYYEEDRLFPRHWQRQCKEIGYSYPALRETIRQQAENLPQLAAEERDRLIRENLFHPVIDRMMRLFEARIDRTLKRFEQEG